MKSVSLLMTLGLLGLAGCVTAPAVTIAPMTKSNDPVVAAVRAEQVTPQSAQKMSQALGDELDREVQQEFISTAIPKR
jgi:hypothetical protein